MGIHILNLNWECDVLFLFCLLNIFHTCVFFFVEMRIVVVVVVVAVMSLLISTVWLLLLYICCLRKKCIQSQPKRNIHFNPLHHAVFAFSALALFTSSSVVTAHSFRYNCIARTVCVAHATYAQV